MNYRIIELFTVLFLLSVGIGSVVHLVRGYAPTVRLYASVFYHQAFVEAFTADLDLVGGVTRMMLLTGATTTPDNPDHEFVDDISADEASDGSYARETLTTPAMADDDANNRAEWDFDDVVFGGLDNETVTAAAAYLQTGGNDASPSDDILIALWDIADTAADGSDFTLQVGSEGAVQFA